MSEVQALDPGSSSEQARASPLELAQDIGSLVDGAVSQPWRPS